MSAAGVVVSIHVFPVKTGPGEKRAEVRAEADRGLEGDRYSRGEGTFSKSHVSPARQVTLIEEEAIAALARDYKVELGPGESRRNILTRGVALNHLVGREFRVGKVTLRGIKLCEPCSHLEKLTQPGVQKALVHRGGLNCQVITGGVIRVGDPVVTDGA